jgi:hypothetical protein
MTGTKGMQSGQDAPEGAEAPRITVLGEESRAARGVGNAPNTQRQDTESDLIPAEVGAA